MLPLVVTIVPEQFDEEKQAFVPPVTVTLQLEHSLVSIHKWESKWNKPFLSNKGMTDEETFDYIIRCMTVTENVDPKIYEYLSQENVTQIRQYIEAPMTATTFAKDNGKKNKEIITAELIYYWMISLQIPVEFQHWHLNQLLTLIRVCNIKNQPPKKMSKRDIMSRNAALNAQRKAQLNTKG